jgi:hypothetical protein
MRAFCPLKLMFIAPLLACALAFGQAGQSTTAQPNPAPSRNAQQPAAQQPTAPPPAKPRPTTPQSVADAARASKQAQQSAPPAKVYRNKDVKDPADAGSPATGDHNAAATPTAKPVIAQTAAKTTAPPTAQPAAQTADDEIKKDRAFEAQGLIFKNQMKVEKGKIIDIQNRIRDLKYQFDAWSTEYAQDPTDAQVCWTSQYYTPYYQDWCDTGRNLKAQYDAAQVQLEQEKAHLEQMQENIRRKGYGNAIYDPD